jgi:hypothetical protein
LWLKERAMPVTRAQVRDIAMAFPGASQYASHGGKPAYRIGRKFFTWVRDELDSLVVYVGSIDERDMLIESDPALFHMTDHYRDWPIVLVRLKRASPKLVRTMLAARFRVIATKKLLAEWEARA